MIFRRAGMALFALPLLAGCGRGRAADAPAAAAQPAPIDWFTDAAHASGLDFIHFNGMSGEFYYPEIMAPGVALLDYDNDGDLDVYVVQGQMLGDKPLTAATFPPSAPLRDRLFRNDVGGGHRLHFTDVTEQSGIDVRTYGMGVAVGDVDNDGWVDIYRTGLAGNVLLKNNGNGTFADVTAHSGTGDRGSWAVSASFVDYDRDGWLDLFVGNYLAYSLDHDVHCSSAAHRRDYCPPTSYRPQQSRLLHNRGDGTFEDVTAHALSGGNFGAALGVSTADFDGDGWLDIYVGNDGQPNQLWMNRHDGTFADAGSLSGSAVSGAGNPEASMGVDAGDFDNDGDEDLFVTNWVDQMNVLYLNDGMGNFDDHRAASGLGLPSLARTGFGTAWFDYDNDGWLDLLVANGGVATIEAQALGDDPFPLRMTDQLYRNLTNGRFEDVSRRAGGVFSAAGVGRGAAFGDVDNDGDVDVVIAQAAGPLQLLLNNVGTRNHWLGLRLVGRAGRSKGERRDMLGARIEISRPGLPTLWRRARSDGSYASANDPRVVVGLDSSSVSPRVRVRWPDGATEQWDGVPVDRYMTLEEGAGK
jgi:hypothetical protein